MSVHAARRANIVTRPHYVLRPDPHALDPLKDKGIRVLLTDEPDRRGRTARSQEAKAELIVLIRRFLPVQPMSVLTAIAAVCQGLHVCRFCWQPYKPKRANAPTTCCYKTVCRKKARNERDKTAYNRDPAKKKVSVKRARRRRLLRGRG